jgi:sugar lactone lactonase YvrE
MRFLRALLLVVLGLIVSGVVFVKLRYGGGQPYPDMSTAPKVPEADVRTLVELDFPPGNIAVAPTGRIFLNYHPFAQARRFTDASMFELVDGKLQPYPSLAFQNTFQGVFGMTVDSQGRLWLTEPASLDHQQTRVRAFDLASNQQVFEHQFPEGEARFAQDLRVSPDGRYLVLADTGLFQFSPASLIVLDLTTKTHRTLLKGHASTQPQDWVTRTPKGDHRLAFGLVTFSVGVDGLAFSNDGNWLYFASMSHDTAYKLATKSLLDPNLSETDLTAALQPIGKKPLSDGIAVDQNGALLITDIEHGGIARLDMNGGLQTLVKLPQISWADGVATAPNSEIMFTDSAIPVYIDQLTRPPAEEVLKAGRPYRVYTFKP